MALHEIFLMLGAIFATGLAADIMARRTSLPRVTLLLVLGVVAGGAGLNLLPRPEDAVQEFLSVTALTMVAFLLGSALSARTLKERGKAIMWLSLAVVMGTLLVVGIGLWLLGLPPGLALLMGAIATATAPAATQDVVAQSGVDNRFTRTLTGVVAIDDAWGLVVFSLCLLVIHQFSGTVPAGDVIGHLGFELVGSVLLGLVVGVPGAWLTGRIRDGEPLQIEALALVFLLSGGALYLGLSYLIAGMVAGAMIVNTARHHDSAFHEIEHIRWPFLVLFFVLAGAALEIEALMTLGTAGIGYVVLRVLSRLVFGWLGAWAGAAPVQERLLYGPALLPQAGVAVGMALIAAQNFPDWRDTIMALTIGTTVLFELIGPPAALWAIRRSQTTPE